MTNLLERYVKGGDVRIEEEYYESENEFAHKMFIIL